MSTQVAAVNPGMGRIEQVLIGGDLSRLNESERLQYYKAVCESVGLNPLTKPFDYITLNGRLTLYARKDATDQLRTIHKVSIKITDSKQVGDVFLVTAEASNSAGRTDSSTGAVSVAGLRGDALANAFMKAETKAKRRVTLSICGLGLLDETELETIPQYAKGEPVSNPTPAVQPKTEQPKVVINPVGQGPKPSPQMGVQPPTGRVAIGKEINEIARQIKLSGDEMVEWIQDRYKKDMKSLTIGEMQDFLGVLQAEAGQKVNA